LAFLPDKEVNEVKYEKNKRKIEKKTFARGGVNPRDILRVEGLGQLKTNSMTSSEIEAASCIQNVNRIM
jgi:predicted hydrolase (HD superfamily)